MKGNPMADHSIISDLGGAVRVQFFDAISSALLYTTGWIRAETPEQALELAWKNGGRAQFNHCQKCGKWVSDVMFNADVHECVACAPWENEPHFCPQCGKRLSPSEVFCPSCGARLRYEGGGQCG